jgi:DNA-binding MarR family transcriptional regulator
MMPDAHLPEAIVERAMGRIRRSMARRTLGRIMAAEMGDPAHAALFETVHAVADAEADEPPTVGEVAERLSIDQSRGSRLVAAAVDAGYLRREASQADGRRSHLVLTDRGRELIATMRAHRLAYFGRIMAEWTPDERATFARLLARFADSATGPGR